LFVAKNLSNLLQKNLPSLKDPFYFKEAILKNSANTLIVDGSITAFPDPTLPEAEGAPVNPGYVLVMRDISQVKRLSAVIGYQASHDSLTGLLNREGLALHLDDILDRIKRDGGEHVLFQIDIDRFKRKTSEMGTACRNAIILKFAERLETLIRHRDLIARIGSDIFALVLMNHDSKTAADTARMIHQLINSTSFSFEEQDFNLTISIGMIRIDGKIAFAEGLLNSVDVACNAAKKEDGNKTVEAL
jgi:two-component system CheB/CheR fusion protein